MTSQFEQHHRAGIDLPLGDTSVLEGVAVMKNFTWAARTETYLGVYPLALSAEPLRQGTRPGLGGHVNITGSG